MAQLESGGLGRGHKRVAELLVGHRLTTDLLGGDDVLPHVLDGLVLELVVGDAHDLQVGVEVGRAVVDEAADAVAQHHVLGGEGAQLAAVEPQVARSLEDDAVEAEALEGVHHNRLEAGQLGVEIGVGVLGEQPGPHHGAAGLVERGAAAVDGPADDLDPERTAAVQVEGGIDIVEPAHVEVRCPPHAGAHDRALALADIAAEDGHAGVGLEGVLRAAVDEPEAFPHVV